MFKCGASVTNRPRRYFPPSRDPLLLRVSPVPLFPRWIFPLFRAPQREPTSGVSTETETLAATATGTRSWDSHGEGRERKKRNEESRIPNTRNRGSRLRETRTDLGESQPRASSTRTRARALVKVGKKSGSGVPRVLDFHSRGRRVTGWPARARIQDRDRRDSFYGCVRPSAASAMNQPPPLLLVPSRCTAVSPSHPTHPPIPPLPSSRSLLTPESPSPPLTRRNADVVAATSRATGNPIFVRGTRSLIA